MIKKVFILMGEINTYKTASPCDFEIVKRYDKIIIGVYPTEKRAQEEGVKFIPESKGVDYLVYTMRKGTNERVLRIIEKPITY